MRQLLWVTALCLASASQLTEARVELHPGIVYTHAHEKVFSDFYPIVFGAQLPQFIEPMRIRFDANRNNKTKHALENMTYVLGEGDEELQQFAREQFDAVSEQVKFRREKRALFGFVGTFLSFCCGVVSEDELPPTGPAMRDHLRALNKQVTEAFDAVTGNNRKVTEFLAHMREKMIRFHDQVMNMVDRMTKEEDAALIDNMAQAYIRMIHMQTHTMNNWNVQYMEQILNSCAARSLDPMVVSKKELRKALLVLNIHLQKNNRKIVYTIEEIAAYYGTGLVRCNFGENKVEFQLQVPVMRIKEEWSILNLQPIDFRFKDHTCALQVPKQVARGVRDMGASVFHATKKSRLAGLAVLEETPVARKMHDCLEKIFGAETTVDQLKQACPLKCTRSTALIVRNLAERDYVITNANGLVMNCGKKSTIVSTEWSLGAVFVYVPCECQLRKGERIMVESKFPCIHQNNYTGIKIVMPQQWLKGAEKSFVQHVTALDNVTTVLDDSWGAAFEGPPQLEEVAVSIYDWSTWPIPKHTNAYATWLIGGLLAWIIVRSPGLLWTGIWTPPPREELRKFRKEVAKMRTYRKPEADRESEADVRGDRPV
ncbi:uncharacterized protein LOC135946470 [Cloeon dipterum]|uniref:uncharacterized protein LOC135946470 n=1 Tax=Cloeon dipterum TaxID=197152 RepID=UPI0032206643